MTYTKAHPKPSRPPKARKRLERRTGLRARGNTKHARRERDFLYMSRVRRLPCIARELVVRGVECEGPIEANHVGGRYGENTDHNCIPMCRKHHEDWTGRVGGGGLFAGWSPSRRRGWGTLAVAVTRETLAVRP